MYQQLPTDDLDPRRSSRAPRRRDWASMSRTVAITRVRDLLATLLIRLCR